MRSSFLLVAIAAAVAIHTPSSAAAQAGPPGGPPPTVPGTAVLYSGPLTVDTLPILCHDAERPEVGFLTETDHPEWMPEVALHLWPTPGAADSISVRYIADGDPVDRTFHVGTPQTGTFTAVVNVVPWDTGRGVDVSFTADCSRRLERGGER